MKIQGWACAAGALLLCACGGGGGGGTGRTQIDPGSSGKISHYAGTFAGPCEQSEARKDSAVGPFLMERTRLTIASASGESARFELRVSFHDALDCSDTAYPQGYNRLEAGNTITIAGVTQTGSRMADRVDVVLQATADGSLGGGFNELPGREAGKSIFVPKAYGAGLTYKDLMYLEGTRLYFGNETIENNGYPGGLDLDAFFTKV